MDTTISVLVFFAVIKVISSDIYHGPKIDPSIPTRCYSFPPGINVIQCCPLPDMNNLQELKACGIGRPGPHDPHFPARSPEHCQKQLCLLKNKGLLNEDETVNHEKVEAFLETWSENQTHFEDSVEIAKQACLRGTKELPQEPFLIRRPDPCPADVVFECIPISIIWNCKINEVYASCRKLKAYMDECRPFLYKSSQESSE